MRRGVQPENVIAGFALLLLQIGAATQRIGGTIGFRVHGLEGGAWILDLDVAGGDWSKDDAGTRVEACDTRIYAYASVFHAILTRPTWIPGLLETGEIVVEGDKTKLRSLSRLMSQGGSLLEQRVNGQKRTRKGRS